MPGRFEGLSEDIKALKSLLFVDEVIFIIASIIPGLLAFEIRIIHHVILWVFGVGERHKLVDIMVSVPAIPTMMSNPRKT